MHSSASGVASRTVKIVGTTIQIDSVPRTLLCASLFPFRVPRSQWRSRLEAVKKLGYHVIDTYAPWNWHEIAPGKYDFTGQRDFEEFLKLAGEVGLYALVRPGPYICSEWDGGAIPAWVSNDPRLRGKLRQNDPDFLAAVGKWYDRIIPIIARQQYDHGGPVILVQADNELDFYACRNPQGYIGALVSMMRRRGITIPIIACAGQGDLHGAGYGVSGVHPAFNIYPNDASADVDRQVRYYRRITDRESQPLIVTETNRWHRTIGRLLGNGVRLIGPYLQASGQDLASGSTFGTSVTNWGSEKSPEAFMTCDYDFGGTIDPTGLERPDASRARRLSTLIGALGTRLAAAQLPDEASIQQEAHELGMQAECAEGSAALGVLNLQGGGRLITLTNLTDHTLTCHSSSRLLASNNDADEGKITLAPRESRLLVTQLPKIATSTVQVEATDCELIGTDPQRRTATFAACATGKPWVLLKQADGSTQFVSHAGTFTVADLTIRILSLDDQAAEEQKTASPAQKKPVRRLTKVGACLEPDSKRFWTAAGMDVGNPQTLEHHHVWNGTGVYTTNLPATLAHGMLGLVINGAADIVSARLVDKDTLQASSCYDASDMTSAQDVPWSDWQANTGQPAWIPSTAFAAPANPASRGNGSNSRSSHQSSSVRLQIRTEIWGHCNFDDARQPALSLQAGRGMTGVIAVTKRENIADGWLLSNDGDPVAGLTIDSACPPRGPLGSRSSTIWPRKVTYRRTLHAAQTSGTDSAALLLSNTHVRACIRLDGRPLANTTPLTPIVWLGTIHEGSMLEITISQQWGEQAGTPILLMGRNLTNWTLTTQGIRELDAQAKALAHNTVSFHQVRLPLAIPSTKDLWLRLPATTLIPSAINGNTLCRFEGSGLQITAWTRSLCLGRIVVGGLPHVVFSGGDSTLLIIPNDGDVLLHVEATKATGGKLSAILLGGAVDQKTGKQ